MSSSLRSGNRHAAPDSQGAHPISLILINVIVFFFELALPQETLEQVFYLFGIVPARFAHPNWAARVGFPVNDYCRY